ncbi:MAG: hypothetical protein E6J34_21660 [Chloroflexi bacterium]|nr:MAG: hypothetical protein E6J34_21660 [Chloroflexota bacterium]
MTRLLPYVHPHVEQTLRHKDQLFQLARLHKGPIHLIFPDIFRENIAYFKAVFAELELQARIYYAHKTNKSKVFVKQALKSGISIDVASLGELTTALACGFTGTRIGCTGAKNRDFLITALHHQCLISLDSLFELQEILKLLDLCALPQARLLIRVSDPQTRDRSLILKGSRFGIPHAQVPIVCELIQTDSRLVLEGFHFHNYEPAEAKAGFVDDMLTLIEDAYTMGLSPHVINIGGGLRTPWLADYRQWSEFIDALAVALKERKPTGTWRNYSYGLFVNERGFIAGQDKMLGEFVTTAPAEVLRDILLDQSLRDRSLADILRENMFEIMLEPGSSIFAHCGISFLRVLGVKNADDAENLLLLDGNTYNLSVFMREQLMDPLLISATESAPQPYGAYLAGNLCKEGDMLLKRKVPFTQVPQAGDLICFVNTAAYTSDFEDASPHQHPLGKKFVVDMRQGAPSFYDEEVYSPYYL